jgi:hypothetical protein
MVRTSFATTMVHHHRRKPWTSDGRPRAPLPAERAFVVQLRADADLGSGAITGRIEHVSSGAAALFDSVEQLIAWMRDAVARSSTQRHE